MRFWFKAANVAEPAKPGGVVEVYALDSETVTTEPTGSPSIGVVEHRSAWETPPAGLADVVPVTIRGQRVW